MSIEAGPRPSPAPMSLEASTPALPVQEAIAPPEKSSRLRGLLGKFALRAGLETVGLAVDVGLMGASTNGVDMLRSVAHREFVASAADRVLEATVVGRLGESQASAELDPQTKAQRVRRIAAKAGRLSVGIATAMAAQKLGPALVDHVNDQLNNGVGAVAVPIASKLAALTAVNRGIDSVAGRIGS